MTLVTNDNERGRLVPRFDSPDAHGRAALLLVESLIHALIANSVIRHEDAIDVINVAVDVKLEIATDLGDSDDTMDKSLTLLLAIRDSLASDTI